MKVLKEYRSTLGWDIVVNKFYSAILYDGILSNDVIYFKNRIFLNRIIFPLRVCCFKRKIDENSNNEYV